MAASDVSYFCVFNKITNKLKIVDFIKMKNMI